MVVGGTSPNEQGITPQNIEMPKGNFEHIPVAAVPVQQSTGIFGMKILDRIVVCGILEEEMRCFSLNYKKLYNEHWVDAVVPYKRSFVATASMIGNESNSEWMITGGVEYTFAGQKALALTEIYSPSNVSIGPSLPEAISKHCMVRLSSDRIVSIGGMGEDSKRESSAHQMNSSLVWEPMPNMTHARHGHACGQYDGLYIVVAGGLNIRGSEIFTLIYNEW